MPLIYVTGAPGIGKSTLQKEFIKRGYDARDIDDSSLGGPHNKATGTIVDIPQARDRTPDWFDAHEWRVYPDAFKRLKDEARNKNIIIFGVASSDSSILPVFDKIMYLDIDDETLTDRVRNRRVNDYGKNDFELVDILNRKHALDRKYSLLDVAQIDASKALNEVAEQIISQL